MPDFTAQRTEPLSQIKSVQNDFSARHAERSKIKSAAVPARLANPQQNSQIASHFRQESRIRFGMKHRLARRPVHALDVIHQYRPFPNTPSGLSTAAKGAKLRSIERAHSRLFQFQQLISISRLPRIPLRLFSLRPRMYQ